MAIKSKKTIPYNFSEKHKKYIRNCRECTYNIAEGAVRAGKTVDNVLAFCRELRDTPDKLHLATASTAPTAKLILGDCNGFGIEHYFRGQRFFVHRDCQNVIDSLCTQVWDAKETTKDVRLDDGTCDIDTADALEYSFSSFINLFNIFS